MCLKLEFQDYKNFLEAARVKHKINCSQKNKIHVDCLQKFVWKCNIKSTTKI